MKVTFANFGPSLASSRLRAAIPQKELAKLGIEKGKDVLIYGKDWIDDDDIAQFKYKIYDVCDDHFNNPSKRDYYLKHCKGAHFVTCNSHAMKQRILDETGRKAFVIQEPYESEELSPSIGSTLLWFGHQSNLVDLQRITPNLIHPLRILTGKDWSLEEQKRLLACPVIVIIPTGKSVAKSENRMVESIRNGKYVCAEHLPAYEPFAQFFPLGDIPTHIERVLGNPKEHLEQIKAAQDYIRERYSPQTIARQWLEVIQCL